MAWVARRYLVSFCLGYKGVVGDYCYEDECSSLPGGDDSPGRRFTGRPSLFAGGGAAGLGLFLFINHLKSAHKINLFKKNYKNSLQTRKIVYTFT